MRPLLRTVKDAQNLNSFGLSLYAINDNERRLNDNELPGTANSANPPHLRELGEQIYLLFNPVALLKGCYWILIGDIVNLCVTILERAREPRDLQE